VFTFAALIVFTEEYYIFSGLDLKEMSKQQPFFNCEKKNWKAEGLFFL